MKEREVSVCERLLRTVLGRAKSWPDYSKLTFVRTPKCLLREWDESGEREGLEVMRKEERKERLECEDRNVTLSLSLFSSSTLFTHSLEEHFLLIQISLFLTLFPFAGASERTLNLQMRSEKQHSGEERNR